MIDMHKQQLLFKSQQYKISQSKSQMRERSSQSQKDYNENRQRSREKTNNKAHYLIGPDLLLTKHCYYLKKAERNIGIPYAVWNFCIKFAKRPAMTLMICQNQTQINRISDVCKLNRPLVKYSDYDHIDLQKLIQRNSAEVLLMTEKKASIICAKEEAPKLFNLILNISFSKDSDYYRRIHEFFVKSGGTIISFIEDTKQFRKIEKSTGITINEVSAEITSDQLNTQMLGDLQFMPKPSPQSLSLLRMLPFNEHQIAGRLFQLLKTRYTSKKSKFLNLTGYNSYQIRTDVEFSSLKYIWNFLKELPQKLLDEIKGMTRFKCSKGVIFDAPEQYKIELDIFIRKQKKNKQKYNDNRFQIDIVEDMSSIPPIENPNDEQIKQLQIIREKALRHKQQFEIFVGGLAYTISEQQLRDFFKKNGVNALTIRISKDQQGNSKGICFVLCEDDSHVRRAVALDGKQLGQRKLKISLAKQRRGH